MAVVNRGNDVKASKDDIHLHDVTFSEKSSDQDFEGFKIACVRTTLEKILLAVTFVLFVVCIVMIALLATEKSKGSVSGSGSDKSKKIEGE